MATETMDPAVPAIRDADLAALQVLLPHLATKADLADLRADLAAVQALLPHLATKADLADLRTEIHAAMNALTWKLAGALLAGLTALAALIVALQIFT